ncbi:hypothetical protein SRHO_G00186900 [Serrasalmus rhombeus]
MWSNSGPKAETLPDHYRNLVSCYQQVYGLRPSSGTELCIKGALDGQGYRAVVGLEEDTWSRVQPKGLDNWLQDLNWQCVHGKLPVREVLYRHGLTSHPRCPRPACAKDESLRHVFWECGYARATWSKVDGLCRALDPQFVLTYEKVMRGWSHDTRSPFLSRMWLLVSVTKRELWNARTSLIQKGTILDIVGIYRNICADLRFRMEHDVIRWGYHAAKERWRDLLELTSFPALPDQDAGHLVDSLQLREDLAEVEPSPPDMAMEQGPRGAPGSHGCVPRTVRFQWRKHRVGVGILFGDRSFEKVSPFTIIQGRALGVDATWRSQNLRVLCVYAPVESSSRIAFLEALASFCITNRHVVVAGDFNINLEGRDDVSVKHFKKLVAGFSLTDGFKLCNPGNPGIPGIIVEGHIAA